MIAKERLQKVRAELGQINGPILPEQQPRLKVDMAGVIKYASSKGMRVIDLDDEEKALFVTPY